jgi:GNAT superfamily N-acetyltransferase
MKIVEYDKDRWSDGVRRLFAAIYPDWSQAQCQRMAYDADNPLHVLTLLAVRSGLPLGQINVFRVGKSAELGNVGYHVHPDWRRKGVASLLLCEAWPRVADRFADGLVIQTNEWNGSSKGFALKAGVVPASEGFIAAHRKYLKFHAYDDGLCFYLPRTKEGPPESLLRTALRTAATFGDG